MKFKSVDVTVNLPDNSTFQDATKVEQAMTALVKALGYTATVSFMTFASVPEPETVNKSG